MIVRPEVAAPILVVASGYALGWWRLRRRGGVVEGWRVAASAGGWLSLVIALSSPLDRLAHASFAAHMTQHLLLIGVAAPLLLLADPFAALCWALPGPIRARAGRQLRVGTPLRGLWRVLTAASVAWLAHVAAVLDLAPARRLRCGHRRSLHPRPRAPGLLRNRACCSGGRSSTRRLDCEPRSATVSAWSIWCSPRCRVRCSVCCSR